MAVDREPANGLTKDAVSGLSLADVGISRFAGAGKVYDLNSPSEFRESMGRSSRLFAIAGGTTKMSMKSQGGVTVGSLKNSGQKSGARWHADQDEVATLSYNCLTNSVGLASIGPKSNMHPPRFPLKLSSGSGNTGRRPVPGAPCKE